MSLLFPVTFFFYLLNQYCISVYYIQYVELDEKELTINLIKTGKSSEIMREILKNLNGTEKLHFCNRIECVCMRS